MKKLLYTFMVLALSLTSVTQGALTNSASQIIDPTYVPFIGSMDSSLDPVYLFCNEVENIVEGTTGFTGATLYVVRIRLL